MGVKESLRWIEGRVNKLPDLQRSCFLSWSSARVGVPLEVEATFEALRKKVFSYEEDMAHEILKGLEDCLEIVSEWRPCLSKDM